MNGGGGSPRLELHLHRDGRPMPVVRFGDRPAAPASLAADQGGGNEPPHPAAFAALVEKVEGAVRRGRTVHLLNIPSDLRLYFELLGKHHLLPKRPKSRPHLPEVLVEF